MDNKHQLLSVGGAAEFLGVSIPTIRRWAKQKKLNGLKVGTRGDWRFRREDLLKLFNMGARDNVEAVRKEEENKTFLLKLIDTIRSFSDPVEILSVVAKSVMDYYKVDRCYFCEIEKGISYIRRDAFRGDLPSVAGLSTPLESIPIFKAVVDAGRPFVVPDSHTTPLMDENLRELCIKMKVISYIDVPVIKDGVPVGILCITYQKPRQWSKSEIDLAEEIADRTWVEVKRAKAEEAIAELIQQTNLDKQRLQTILETSPAAVVVLDAPDGRFSFINKRAMDLYGIDFMGASLATNVAKVRAKRPDGRPYRVDEVPASRALRKGEIVRNEELIISRADGVSIPVMVSAAPMRDAKGNIVSAVVIFEDITERKKAEESLRESEEKANLLIKHAPSMLYEIDFRGPRFVNVNDNLCQTLGYTREELMKKNPMDLLEPESKKVFKDRIEKFAAGEEVPNSIEYTARKKDGSLIYGILNTTFTRINGKPEGAFVVAHDITERKKAEKALEEVNRRKDEFISIASHELKTPVTSIKAYAQVLRNKFQKSGDMQSAGYMGKLDGQINKLIALISDLLDATKIEAGKLRLHERLYSFDELVGEMVGEAQLLTDEQTIEKVGKTKKTVFGDRERAAQVLINLLTNAIKYSKRTSKIIVSSSADNAQVKLCVKDFGVGIAKDKQPHIFERFYRAEGISQNTIPGLGLGLYIAAEIIKRQNGRIWVESGEGKGATFCFTLPIRKRKPSVLTGFTPQA